MKNCTIWRTIMSAAAILMSVSVYAQEEKKFEITPSADLVSSYIWRGQYQTGVSIQPTLNFSYAGFSLEAWGSTDFSAGTDEVRSKEIDLTLGYEYGGFSISVIDYWWSGEGTRYGRYSTDHYFEGVFGYNFGESFPLSLSWSSFFAGGDIDENGDQNFSTYIEASYEVNVMGINLTPAIGISPWTGMYNKAGGSGFTVPSISLTASKDIKFTDSFSLPFFTQFIVSPEHDNVYFAAGVSF